MCPFCSSENLKFHTETYPWDFSVNNQESFECRDCDARGPVSDLYELPDDTDFWEACQEGRWVDPVWGYQYDAEVRV